MHKTKGIMKHNSTIYAFCIRYLINNKIGQHIAFLFVLELFYSSALIFLSTSRFHCLSFSFCLLLFVVPTVWILMAFHVTLTACSILFYLFICHIFTFFFGLTSSCASKNNGSACFSIHFFI